MDPRRTDATAGDRGSIRCLSLDTNPGEGTPWDHLYGLMRNITREPGVQVIILTGIPSLPTNPPVSEAALIPWRLAMEWFLTAVESAPQPVIAVLDGDAMGIQLEVLLACDLVVAADHTRLGFPPGATVTSTDNLRRLAAAIGVRQAKDLVFSGRVLEAREAQAMGLISTLVTSQEQYEARAWAVAEAVAEAVAVNGSSVISQAKWTLAGEEPLSNID